MASATAMTDLGVAEEGDPVSVVRSSPASRASEGGMSTPREVYDAGFSYVHHTLRRLGVRDADLEDITHDVFIRVFRHQADFDVTRPLKPWLFGFAYRTAQEYRRKAVNRREVLLDVELDTASPSPAPDESAAENQARAQLLVLLEGLSLEQRAVFVLHDLDACTMPEIAESLCIPLNTAYSRLRLARAQLETSLNRMRRRGDR
jgi:RNA polymerase sigma-70 factor (ECF subfamily)